MKYNELPTAVLIDSLPQNRPLYKDSGLWTIYDDKFETAIFEQTANEDFRQFLVRYYEFISEFEDTKGVHIDLACSNLL